MKKVNLILNSSDPKTEGLTLCADVNLLTGKKEFLNSFATITSLEEDLLNLGATIFGADIATKRGTQEEITRDFDITIPVINLPAFKQICDEIQYALYTLSHDSWKINFIQRTGQPEKTQNRNRTQSGKVLLFSGGLDSFAAAVKFGDEGQTVQLVSHITANQVISSTQQTLVDYLDQAYPSKFTRDFFRVSGVGKPKKDLPFPSDEKREETQRTRSFMFLSLAALVARRKGFNDLVVLAENGQMAIHLPLSAGRISAFSTHTAHPEFVATMGNILSTVLNYEIRIENPFLYMTKAEVVKNLFSTHQSKVENTVSCWKASRVSHYNHCGICIPCLIRRIALESNGLFLPEYQVDLFASDVLSKEPDNDGKRNLVELCEFVSTFLPERSMAEFTNLYPELATSSYDSYQAVSMYRRFSQEAMQVFRCYPNVMALME